MKNKTKTKKFIADEEQIYPVEDRKDENLKSRIIISEKSNVSVEFGILKIDVPDSAPQKIYFSIYILKYLSLNESTIELKASAINMIKLFFTEKEAAEKAFEDIALSWREVLSHYKTKNQENL